MQGYLRQPQRIQKPSKHHSYNLKNLGSYKWFFTVFHLNQSVFGVELYYFD